METVNIIWGQVLVILWPSDQPIQIILQNNFPNKLFGGLKMASKTRDS